VSPRARARAADVAVAAAFAASAAVLFVMGDERDGSLPFFLAWAAVHVLYGLLTGSFWALLIVVTCPPLFVATSSGNGDDMPLWLQSFFVEAFYGVPFAFIGVLARRLWQLRRQELPATPGREETGE
jgi:hypothetical protein